METLFAWLHLADIHLCHGLPERWDPNTIRAALLRDVARLSAEAVAPDAILVTGDIASEGLDYADAEAWLDELASTLGLSAGDVYAVPGNHDVDRRADRSRGVARLLSALRDGHDAIDEALADTGDRALLARRFQGYLDFAMRRAPASLDPKAAPEQSLYWVHRRTVRGTQVRLVGLNTVLLWSHEEDGKLRLGATQAAAAEAPNGELVVALSHHPFAGGFLADEKSAAAMLESHIHVHLVSRAYEPAGDPGAGRRIGAGTIREGDNTGFGYNLASISAAADRSLRLRVWPRRWSPRNQEFRTDVDALPDGQSFAERPLPGRLLDTGPGKPSTQVIALNAARSASRVDPASINVAARRMTGYLSELAVENVRSIRSLIWNGPPKPGWHAIIGDNGSGKSSLLRAIAVALLGTAAQPGENDSAQALRLDPEAWVRRDEAMATVSIAVSIQHTPGLSTSTQVSLHRNGYWVMSTEVIMESLFSAGFGPFRRFSGGDADYEKDFQALPRVARHLSLFDERVSLTESLRWLKDLQFKALENASNAAFLTQMKTFINQEGFLPNGVQLQEITSDKVNFVDGDGCKVAIEELSDGYRSILSLIIELIRQLSAHHGPEHVFDINARTVNAPGIVLIDEVDAHLHPTWQREIGLQLRTLFPRIQFLVTTHSPLVCQAADVGTVFRLPQPGAEDQGRMLEGVELDRLLYGNVLDAFGTLAFGSVTRSEEGAKRLERLAELNRKELRAGLSAEEEKEQDQLRAIFPTARSTGEPQP